MDSPSAPIAAALARLDADIVAAEARLAELRLTRKGAEALLRYLAVEGERPISEITVKHIGPATLTTDAVSVWHEHLTGGSHAAIIEGIIAERGLREFSTKGMLQFVRAQGHDLTPTQVSNAVTWLRRKKPPVVAKIEGQGRGHWRVVAPSTDSNDAESQSASLPSLSSPLEAEATTG